MAGITPIPTTRVGDYFIRQRLVAQVQADQLDLFRLQTQVSTGRRIVRPSDDAPAALRAIALQRTIQRKAQSERNLAGSRSVLVEAETALKSVADTLRNVKGSAITSVSNLTSEESRNAAIADIDAALDLLLNSSNANYNGRYLFAGSRTSELPFDYAGEFIEYRGNEKSLQSYVDLEQLFTTNLPGTEVFGGVSGEVRGSTDLNPQLTKNTLLTSINGGDGINTNSAISINVDNGLATNSSIIDLSGAVTIGDVIRRIEANPPAGGASIRVDIVDNGLTVRTSAGTVRVGEVAAGRAARELGISTPMTVVPGPSMVGSDLDPVVRKTTPLSDLFGTKASVRLNTTNANNDVVVTSATNGVAWNGVSVVYATGGTAGSENVNYNSGTKVLTIQVQDGESTANDVIAAINAEGTFTAKLDGRDTTNTDLAGTGTVSSTTFLDTTDGGSGTALDTTSGLILTNGGDPVLLDISTAETVEDFFNLISGANVGLAGEINAEGNGIDVRSVLSGADFTIGENGGTTATQLGIRTYTAETQLADFNRGIGAATTSDLETLDATKLDSLAIVARNGTALAINLVGSTSLQDVVDSINTAPGNNTLGTAVLARLSSNGNSIELVDSSTPTTGNLVVQNPIGTQAAEYLGFVPAGETQSSTNATDVDGNYTIGGANVLGNDLLIVARDGTELWIDLAGATSVQDVLDRVNTAAGNNSGTTAVLARLVATGNGIELVDSSTTATPTDLIVRTVEGSQAAQYLGFVPDDRTQVSSNIGSGGNYTLTSEDRHTYEVDSVFNSLIRLRRALQDGDAVAVGEAVERIDVDLHRAVVASGEIGSRLQSLDVVETRLEDENVQLQSALSNEIDVDLFEAISQLTARQYALQASLQTAASILNMSILDFI